MYNQDRYMFVAIMGSNRLKFAAEDLLSGTKEEEAPGLSQRAALIRLLYRRRCVERIKELST
jgi:hypothetical protein